MGLMLMAFGAGCNTHTKPTDKKMIAVSITPQAEIVATLADTLVKVWTIVPEGKNPEIYDPQPYEMKHLADCDAYLYVGGLGFETAWAERIGQMSAHIKLYRLTDDSHDHAHCNHTHCDPHIWTSPQGIALIARRSCEALQAIDPAHATFYAERLTSLQQEVSKVKARVEAILAETTQRAFVIYHPSLTGFAEEFGCKQLVIERNGKEPTAEQLKELIDEAKKSGVRTVFIQKEFNTELAQSVAETIGAKVVTIAPLSADWTKQMMEVAEALATSNERK